MEIPLRNKIDAAYLLADKSKKLETASGEQAMIKGLPAKAPDPTDTVIAAEITGAPQVVEQRVRQADDGSLTLLAIDADVQGSKAKIEKKGSNPYNIGYWTSAADIAQWHAEFKKGGKFTVLLEYSLAPNSKGSEIAIEVGQVKVPVKLEAGKDFLDFKTVEVGTVDVESGPIIVTVRPTAKPGLAVMDLRKIVLKPSGG
jgi:alpha-L-fucosidase